MKKTSDAIADFDKSIELNPEYFKAYLRRGDVRNATGDFDGAALDYKRVLELD
jgi:tetratricopeptide (TPR) repeat protein